MGKNYFTSLLEELGVAYTPEYADELFTTHPYRYTLFGLRSMLRHYGISSEAVKITDKSAGLDKLSPAVPFVAEAQRDLVMVTSVSDRVVEFFRYGKTVLVERRSFEMVWTGVALILTHTEGAAEPNFRANRRNHLLRLLEKYGMIMTGTLLLVCTAFFSGVFSSPWLCSQLALSLGGLSLSLLLIAKSLKIPQKTADRICSLIHARDCKDILELPVSRLFGRYGWSEIGTAYFLSSAILIALCPEGTVSVFPWIAVCSMAYPIWSISYQKFVAKKWCALCLGVQAVLLIQGSTAIVELSLNGITRPDHTALALFICSYIFGGLIVMNLTGLLKDRFQLRKVSEEYSSLRFNDSVMEALFSRRETLECPETSLVFGSGESGMTVTVFSNLFCSHCSDIHPKISALYKAGCRIEYCLSSFDSELMRFTERAVTYCQNHTPEEGWRMLDAWYSGGKSRGESFFDDFPATITEAAKAEAGKHWDWANRQGLTGTPTLLFNYRKLPREYSEEDMIFLMNNR